MYIASLHAAVGTGMGTWEYGYMGMGTGMVTWI